MSLTPEQADALNRAAVFHPFASAVGDGTPAYPAIQIGGAWVFAYAHPERGLQISVHLDETEAPLLVGDRNVPMQIDITGETPLYVADQQGNEMYPQLQAEVADAVEALEGVQSRIGR
jgi:hypothetical protein